MATPAHRKQGDEPARTPWSVARIIAAVAVATVVIGAGVATAVVVTRHQNKSTATGRAGSGATPVGGTSVASTTPASGSGPGKAAPTTTTTVPLVALSVRSVKPATSAKGVATDEAISIRFSHPLAPTSPTPTLSPPILGTWFHRGSSLVFRPTAGYIPSTQVTVKVPATTAALEGTRSVRLGHAYQTSFNIGTGSVLRLQQLLAELGYLPLSFVRTPSRAATTTTTAPAGAATTTAPAGAATTALVSSTGLASEPATVDAISTNPRPGQFVWKYSDTPASLQAEWQQGTYNLVTKGAVMAFEGDHGLGVDGVAGPAVWTAILSAVAHRQTDPRPYSYIMVNEEGVEYLRVWQGGSIVYTSPANTGVPGAATQQGTFAVETHYTSTEMKGTDVDGSTYDVVVPYAAYFNGGDAIHGYDRASYGYPQSNGCVELPPENAGFIFNNGDDWYGTLVTVS